MTLKEAFARARMKDTITRGRGDITVKWLSFEDFRANHRLGSDAVNSTKWRVIRASQNRGER